MLFSGQDYKIVWDAIKEIKKESSASICEMETFINSLGATKKRNKGFDYIMSYNDLKDIVENSAWDKISQFETGILKVNYNAYGRNFSTVDPWFYEADRKIFNLIQIKLKNELDLLNYLQGNIITLLGRKDIDETKFAQLSKQYAVQVLGANYDYLQSVSHQKIFELTTKQFCKQYQKEHHIFALGLIKKAIENKSDQNSVLDYFKAFVDANKTISSQAKKDFDWVKEKIKDWDLSNHFSINEKKMLYANEDGIIAKKVEGLFYNLDINQIKTKTKTKSSVIGTNLRLLIKVLPEALANISNYVGMTQNFKDPQMQFNILFETGVDNIQIQAMNNLVQVTIESKVVFIEEEMKNRIDKTLLSFFLEEKLAEKITHTKKPKI